MTKKNLFLMFQLPSPLTKSFARYAFAHPSLFCSIPTRLLKWRTCGCYGYFKYCRQLCMKSLNYGYESRRIVLRRIHLWSSNFCHWQKFVINQRRVGLIFGFGVNVQWSMFWRKCFPGGLLSRQKRFTSQELEQDVIAATHKNSEQAYLLWKTLTY